MRFLLLATVALMPSMALATSPRPQPQPATSAQAAAAASARATAGAAAIARQSQQQAAVAAAQGGAGGSVTSSTTVVAGGGSGALQAPSIGGLAAYPTAQCERIAGIGGSGPGGGGLLQFSWGVDWCRVLMEAQAFAALGDREAARAHLLRHNERMRETAAEAARPSFEQLAAAALLPAPALPLPPRPAYCATPGIQNPECR